MNKILFFAFSFCIFVVFCFLSCKNSNYAGIDYAEFKRIIAVNPAEAKEVSYSDLFQEVDYIQIPTDSAFLIGSIGKLIVIDGYVIIMDNSISRSLFIFDMNNNTKTCLHKLGNGPGEYIALTDFFYDRKKKELGIYCLYKRKIFYYSLLGEYKREEKVDLYAGRIIPLGNTYAMYCEFKRNEKLKKRQQYPNVALMGKSGQLTCSDSFFSNVNVSVVWSSLPDFSQINQNTIAVRPDHSNIVYHITHDSIKPAYYIDFRRYNIDKRYWEKTRERGINTGMVDEYCNSIGFCEIYNFRQDSTCLFFNYRQKNEIYFAFSSLKTGKTVNASRFLNDMDKITMFRPKFFSNNKFYCVLEAGDVFKYKKFLEEQKLLPAKILDGIQEFDNPLIAVFTLKKDF